jgi:predicted RNA methylase
LIEDGVFDAIYPEDVRRLSPTHWTPVEAAVRAAQLLTRSPGARILDVGSGVGKFCIIAAAAVEASVSGVEQRGRLVDIAKGAAAVLGVDVRFTHGTLADCDPAQVDGVYFFNPFAENHCLPSDRIDDAVELSESRRLRDVAQARDFLRAAHVGTRVVTYCGFGGELPDDYECISRERRAGILELWVKAHAPKRARLPRWAEHDG